MLKILLDKKIKNEGMSVRSAAREIGVSHTTITRLLDGYEIDLPTLKAVCTWLGVSPASALNSLADTSDEFAAKLALAIEAKPQLQSVFEEAIDKVIEGKIPVEVLNDLIAYASFRLSQYQEGK